MAVVEVGDGGGGVVLLRRRRRRSLREENPWRKRREGGRESVGIVRTRLDGGGNWDSHEKFFEVLGFLCKLPILMPL